MPSSKSSTHSTNRQRVKQAADHSSSRPADTATKQSKHATKSKPTPLSTKHGAEPPKQPSRKKYIKQMLAQLTASCSYFPDKEFKEHLTRYERGYYNYCDKPPSLEMPHEIKNFLQIYRQRLAEGDKSYSRAEDLYRRAQRQPNLRYKVISLTKSSQLHLRAQSEYDHANEALEEALNACPGLFVWLDRPTVINSLECTTSPCPSGMPRPIDSRSPHNLHFRPTSNKRLLQLTLLQEILECIDKGISYEQLQEENRLEVLKIISSEELND